MHSQPKRIQRKPHQTSDEASNLEEEIQRVINEIHALSGENTNTRSFSASYTAGGLDLNAYYRALSDLYAVFQPLLRDRFVEDLPKTLVCILSNRQDCGLEAELTKTVSLELGKPLLSFMSSLRSETCTSQNHDGGSASFLNAYLRIGESTSSAFDGFQNTVINILYGLPLSGSLMETMRGLADAAVTYVSDFMATFLKVPLDYIKLALQFGIRIPSLDGKETCEQGKNIISHSLSHCTVRYAVNYLYFTLSFVLLFCRRSQAAHYVVSPLLNTHMSHFTLELPRRTSHQR